ncbi:kanamycin nucleotidyltransferase C-terminal domain-containing protein [Paenibacillus sp. FSL W8-0194]|uniref:kanamycin nucleotidyltransferase C-terminal domain-containing protein n=1 Tax=Paenibacillus sp. FSL W8-0194 TaxID=2921711 RepID=UPI0030D99959
MLIPISEYPVDKKIAGIHSVPITDDGMVVMVWDQNEKVLTTIGGRLEQHEGIHEALNREAIEEAGVILDAVRIPIAAWYWENTDTYTVFVAAKVKDYTAVPDGFETTGRVIMNFETARQMVRRLEGDSHRIKVLDLAEEAYLKCLLFPFPASREEKLQMVDEIKNRLLELHGDDILAIGIYGSTALGKEGPFSDIELHVVSADGVQIQGHEFIYDRFKIEISPKQKSEMIRQAAEVDDSWPIKAGVYINVLPVYDPGRFFEELSRIPMQVPQEAIRSVMREFMIWEPYETMGKIRNNFTSGNWGYLPMGAKDLTWQTAKLIGLANRQFYSTRAKTFEESLNMASKPAGYAELVTRVMEGKLMDKEHVYRLCENLWTGLNAWYEELGIEYRSKELPF